MPRITIRGGSKASSLASGAPRLYNSHNSNAVMVPGPALSSSKNNNQTSTRFMRNCWTLAFALLLAAFLSCFSSMKPSLGQDVFRVVSSSDTQMKNPRQDVLRNQYDPKVKGVVASDGPSQRENNNSQSKESFSTLKNGLDPRINDLVAKYPSCQGKQAFLNIVLKAIDYELDTNDAKAVSELCQKLPLEDDVAERYGPKPIVLGLETCPAYRKSLQTNGKATIEPMPRVAGLYHTGTNMLTQALEINFPVTWDPNLKKGINHEPGPSPLQVPWGKHIPSTSRFDNTYPKNNGVDKTKVMPIVVIRDPFFWMQSMCKARYDAMWDRGEDFRCPNLVRDDKPDETVEIFVNTHASGRKLKYTYKSLADMWTKWNREYLESDTPRLIIRFEDMMYHLEEILQTIRDCVGPPVGRKDYDPLRYEIGDAKPHGNPTGFVDALPKQASDEKRHKGLNAKDRHYAHQALDAELMEIFHYNQVPLQVPEADISGPYIDYWQED